MNPHAEIRSGMASAGDPVTELDDELRWLRAEVQVCRVRGEHVRARRLAEMIDERLEERHVLTGDAQGRGQSARAVVFSGWSRARADTQSGQSAAQAAERAGAVIAEAARDRRVSCTGVRVRIAGVPAGASGPVVAQANAVLGGRPIRVQAAALSLRSASELLLALAEERVGASAGPWSPRPHPDPARARALAAPLIWRNDGEITRIKAVTTAVCPVQSAAVAMDALDYDIHLFTDLASGEDAAVHRSGPTGYTLSRITPGARPHPSGPPLTLDPRRAPWLTGAQAAAHLSVTGRPFLFFADPGSGRGRVLYRRYDGHYTLLGPSGDAAFG